MMSLAVVMASDTPVGLGVTQAHAVLRAAGGVEGVLHGHGHLLEREDRVATQVAGGIAHRKIK